MNKNYYNILGVPAQASLTEIKKAYRILAHRYHPDKQGGNEAKFKEINEAYQVLSNKDKRAQYDKFGQVFSDSGQSHGFSAGADFSDILRQFGLGFNQGARFGFNLEDLMEEFLGRQSRPKKSSSQADIGLDMDITFKEAIFGVKKEISLKRLTACDHCQGTGAEPGSKQVACDACQGKGVKEQQQQTPFGIFHARRSCEVCQGRGKVPEKKCRVCQGAGLARTVKPVQIQIPVGIKDGQELVLKGEGEAGGNLFVRVHVEPHDLFKREGDLVVLTGDIPFSLAALGGQLTIPTLTGNKEINIKKGTQTGQEMFVSTDNPLGGLLVRFRVVVPKRINRAQKKIIAKLKEQGL